MTMIPHTEWGPTSYRRPPGGPIFFRDHLPYGYWFTEDTKEEWLFNRSYAPIWRRHYRDRLRTVRPVHPEPDGYYINPWVHHVFQAYFDHGGCWAGSEPGRETVERAGRVLGLFLGGLDVRPLLDLTKPHDRPFTFPDGTRIGDPANA